MILANNITCKRGSKIGMLCTEATLKTKVYNRYFDNDIELTPVNVGTLMEEDNWGKGC